MTFAQAARILGISRYSTREHALTIWKSMTVRSVRLGDYDSCKCLSQAKEAIKRHYPSRCVDCGVVLSKGKTRCMMHHIIFKHYSKALRP